ncbi:hypothetical protein SARC_01805 [Sphaeroforma arctica JP610]|uniref:Uncharacterized protein n=1 Tax=Sphaeroforma arctica JP610 TaxID=667725 RepID=A0A0L0GAJ6_9EUKA|nr:hypothetical protein SARC_01805 [Sphaeroforma arctica JP610]KNC86047.1 hypothetical protein SARC_01805 [Sphaeroforma arctica JP610]|eukprot:XP_014159949.1 hypothetical protein SARC_01805 [Sphaeroforma arctica JP610]
MPQGKTKHLSGGRDKRHSLYGQGNQFIPVTQAEAYVPDAEENASSDSDNNLNDDDIGGEDNAS